ncbi:MAG: hypothetical protein R3D98_13715 [Candidatus Krumholzibacteriia bacterium]
MQRLVGYLAASVASGVGWKLGSLLGPFAAYFISILAGAIGLYLTRRWLSEALG